VGKGTVSVNQSPQYGDKKVLDSVKKSTQAAPISGAAVPVRTAGRPATGQSQPNAAEDIAPEELAAINDLARQDFTYQTLAAAAEQPGAGLWVRFYAELARRARDGRGLDTYKRTKNFI